MTPEDFESRDLSPAGAGFSIAPHFSQSAWFRFHNRGEGPRNLYLVGAGSHPGAGLPGVLSSAKVVDRFASLGGRGACAAHAGGSASMTAVAADHGAVRDVPVAARSVLRRHGRTFFFASHLLGSRHAERAATLYAFCRHVDDLADDAGDPRAARAALAGVANALLTGRANDPCTASMLSLQASTGLAVAPALELVAGVISDLDAVRMADEPALIRYAYQVAGTVGLMMCAVLDVHDPRAHPFAIDLGIAMQLTNIARDVGEDARMDRRYLPASWIGDVPPVDIAAPGPLLQRTLCDATRRLLARADRHYSSAESGFGFLPARARLAILTAAHTYRAIGTRIAANGYRSWDQRAVVGSTAKAGHAARALLAFALSPRLHRRDALHEASLQIALARQDGMHG